MKKVTIYKQTQLTEQEFYDYLGKFVRRTLNGCWEWQGSLDHAGYGQWSRGGSAHRRMYEFIRGAIPEGLTLDHLCRNRKCVKPSHLEAVTLGENTRRSPFTLNSINRSKTHCPHGHEYSQKNTYYRPNGKGRKCRVCNANRERYGTVNV